MFIACYDTCSAKIATCVCPCCLCTAGTTTVTATHVDLFFARLSSQNRIEEAHTSDTLKKTVGMTRSMDMAAEREKGERARAAAQRAKDLPVESKETPDPR